MKTKIVNIPKGIIAFVFITLSLISCKEPLGIEENVRKTYSSNELIPLSVGNRWSYKVTESADSGEIIEKDVEYIISGDTLINGIKWFIISSDSYRDTFCVRLDSEGLWLTGANSHWDQILNYQLPGVNNPVRITMLSDTLTGNRYLERYLSDAYENLKLNEVTYYCLKYIDKVKFDSLQAADNLSSYRYFCRGLGLVLVIEYKISPIGEMQFYRKKELISYKIN